MEKIEYNELNEEIKQLIDAAQEGMKLAYPQNGSDKKVGAAIKTKSGDIIIGGAFGNNSSTSNICAESSVISTANNKGFRDIVGIAIIGHSDKKPFLEPITPCGICRQVIQELTLINGHDIKIYCSNQDKSKILVTSIHELLPYSY